MKWKCNNFWERKLVGIKFVKLLLCQTHFKARKRPIKLTGVGLAPSSQTVGSLSRTPRLAKPAGKMDSAKSQFDEPCVDQKNLWLWQNFYFFQFNAIPTFWKKRFFVETSNWFSVFFLKLLSDCPCCKTLFVCHWFSDMIS